MYYVVARWLEPDEAHEGEGPEGALTHAMLVGESYGSWEHAVAQANVLNREEEERNGDRSFDVFNVAPLHAALV